MLEPHRPIYSQGNPEFRGRLANHGACQGNLGIHPLASVYHAPCRRSAGRPLRRHQATVPGRYGLRLLVIRQEIVLQPLRQVSLWWIK